jgi:hydrogenase maturation protein HypF
MIEAVLTDTVAGLTVGTRSSRFHEALVEVIVSVARTAAAPQVVLSGGCFQNRRLLERSIRRLHEAGFRPYWPQRVPPNDGGIALGQVAACRWGDHPGPF